MRERESVCERDSVCVRVSVCVREKRGLGEGEGVSLCWAVYYLVFLLLLGLDTKGLFRRAASKAKVGALKTRNEANPG